MTHFIPQSDTNKDGDSIAATKLRELFEQYKALGSRIHLVEHKMGADLLENAYFKRITRDERPRFTPTHTTTITTTTIEGYIGKRVRIIKSRGKTKGGSFHLDFESLFENDQPRLNLSHTQNSLKSQKKTLTQPTI